MSDNDPDSKLPRGRLGRLSRIVGMGAKVGTTLVSGQMRKALGTESETNRIAAEKILATLGEMKGAALKMGQTLSLGANHFPPEVRDVVSKLFSQAPAMSYDDMNSVFSEELGSPPDEVFASFEREPFAAASLGQVHRARLHSGESVAVKVQYPGIGEAVESDMKNAATLVRTLGLGTNIFDGKAYFGELRGELESELDYGQELARLREYSSYLAEWEGLCAPRPFEEFCTKRVFTVEFFDGPTLHEWISQNRDASADERFRLGMLLTRAVYGPFFVHRVIHADTHPGNFIVRPDGRIGVLDFGATKRFTPEFALCLRRAVERGVAGEPANLAELMGKGGFTIGLPEDKANALLDEIATIVGRPLLAPYDFGDDSIVEDVKRLGKKRAAELLRVRPPAEGLLFFRAIAGLTHNLRALRAAGDWRPFFREALERAAQTQARGVPE